MAPMTKRHFCSLSLQRAPANAGEVRRIVISTVDEDREGDILEPEGMRTADYDRNPIVKYAHDMYGIPIGRTVYLNVVPGKGISADFTFLKGDVFASRVENAFDQGVLNAASVGFLPKKWEPNGTRGLRYTEWDLLEWSIVPIPANPAAVRTLKSLRLDGPAPLARSVVALDQLTAELKAGRMLSAANESRLREASDLLNAVLAQVDEEDDGEKGVIVISDGDIMELTPDLIAAGVKQFVDGEIAKATGAIPEPPTLLAKKADQGPVVRMSEEALTALVRDAINNTIARMPGRVD